MEIIIIYWKKKVILRKSKVIWIKIVLIFYFCSNINVFLFLFELIYKEGEKKLSIYYMFDFLMNIIEKF